MHGAIGTRKRCVCGRVLPTANVFPPSVENVNGMYPSMLEFLPPNACQRFEIVNNEPQCVLFVHLSQPH
eukprot:COSAG06_NODE_416_length_15996_cov_260.778637_4_plen_69_part_00